MIIHDRIYGEISITHPLIVDLIHSKPFQRLKKIHQVGATYLIRPTLTITRYEHSIGVWYLAQKYKRSMEEQVASLLHDLPHTTFSHVIDYVFPNKEHNYHDQFIEKIINESEIPTICKKYRVNLKNILQTEKFPLLSNKLPDISFDRWDYFMRDGFNLGVIPTQTIKLFLENIKEENNLFYFEDLRIASLFSILFLNCFRLLWNDPTGHGSYFLLANALILGIKKNIISEHDFFTTDNEVLDLLKGANESEINVYLDKLQPGKEFVYAERDSSDFYGPNKVRLVDPWVQGHGGLQRISELVLGLKYYMEEIKERYNVVGVKQIESV